MPGGGVIRRRRDRPGLGHQPGRVVRRCGYSPQQDRWTPESAAIGGSVTPRSEEGRGVTWHLGRLHPHRPDVMTPAAPQPTPAVPAQPKPTAPTAAAPASVPTTTPDISCAGRTANRYRQRRRRKITQITTMATAVPTNDHLVSPSLYGTHTMAVRSKGSPPTGNEQQHDAIRNQRSAHRP